MNTKIHFKQLPKGSKILATYESESRINLWHDVYLDVNENIGCTCESFTYGHNPCKHMKQWIGQYREKVEMGSKLAEQIIWISESI